jgi:hypothetical protein
MDQAYRDLGLIKIQIHPEDDPDTSNYSFRYIYPSDVDFQPWSPRNISDQLDRPRENHWCHPPLPLPLLVPPGGGRRAVLPPPAYSSACDLQAAPLCNHPRKRIPREGGWQEVCSNVVRKAVTASHDPLACSDGRVWQTILLSIYRWF